MPYLIEAGNPSEAWFEATKYILENGKSVGDLKEILYLLVEIREPLKINEQIDKAFRGIPILGKKSGEEWIEWGINQLDASSLAQDKSWKSRYFTRLSKYRDKVNQLEYVINALQKKPRSKQLFCITFDPEVDIRPDMPYSPRMPCLTVTDFKDRDDKLNLFALFRSHDFGRKAYGNYLGLGKLSAYICKESSRNIGKVICLSLSAHIRSSESKELQRIVSALLKRVF